MMFLKAFLVGGFISLIGQVLVDKTKLTSARILVVFVIAGAILGGIGLYPKLVEFAGAGAAVHLPGFGNILVKGTLEEIRREGPIGILTGGLRAAAAGIMAALSFSFLAGLLFQSKEK